MVVDRIKRDRDQIAKIFCLMRTCNGCNFFKAGGGRWYFENDKPIMDSSPYCTKNIDIKYYQMLYKNEEPILLFYMSNEEVYCSKHSRYSIDDDPRVFAKKRVEKNTSKLYKSIFDVWMLPFKFFEYVMKRDLK